MKSFRKKRIDIIVEAPLVSRVIAIFDEHDVSGYTVIPAISGRGNVGLWQRDSHARRISSAVLIFCVVDESREDELLEPLFELVSRQIGIITVSDVRVIRGDKFN